MMQPIPGGAAARPFVTHHNALDLRPVPAHRARAVPQAPGGRRLRARLRDQPQLPQRGPVDAAQPRVHDARALPGLCRLPRPDGPDRAHDPRLSPDAWLGALQFEYQGRAFDLGAAVPPRVDGARRCSSTTRSSTRRGCATCRYLRGALRAARHPRSSRATAPASCCSRSSRRPVEHTLLEPTFVTHYPAEVSPLARANDADPFLTDRFEFFVGGRELANGFSELNDPEDQAARFRAQVDAQGRRRRRGDVLRRRLHPRARVRHAADRRASASASTGW